jgi:Zn-finger nucleic acid-binding protein
MCKKAELHPSSYDGQLPINVCHACGGAWLRANDYAYWLKTQSPGKYDLVQAAEITHRFPVSDSNQAAICPDCGHLLRSYQIASSIDFHLDRCGNCNGIWLDKNEWEALKAADLHDEVYRFFTQPWQKHIQDEVTARKLDEMYQERFGDLDYERIKEIRNWLQGHPKQNLLLAYLLDHDPYSS